MSHNELQAEPRVDPPSQAQVEMSFEPGVESLSSELRAMVSLESRADL